VSDRPGEPEKLYPLFDGPAIRETVGNPSCVQRATLDVFQIAAQIPASVTGNSVSSSVTLWMHSSKPSDRRMHKHAGRRIFPISPKS